MGGKRARLAVLLNKDPCSPLNHSRSLNQLITQLLTIFVLAIIIQNYQTKSHPFSWRDNILNLRIQTELYLPKDPIIQWYRSYFVIEKVRFLYAIVF